MYSCEFFQFQSSLSSVCHDYEGVLWRKGLFYLFHFEIAQKFSVIIDHYIIWGVRTMNFIIDISMQLALRIILVVPSIWQGIKQSNLSTTVYFKRLSRTLKVNIGNLYKDNVQRFSLMRVYLVWMKCKPWNSVECCLFQVGRTFSKYLTQTIFKFNLLPSMT